MATTVYSTSTPIIARAKYSFNYRRKRDAYVDACYACYELNRAAKTARDNYRHYIYRLKLRWVAKLYKDGFCVQAEMGERLVWKTVYLVDGVKFCWHIPDNVATWTIKENRTAVFYEWRDKMLRWHGSLDEAVALLEWCLG